MPFANSLHFGPSSGIKPMPSSINISPVDGGAQAFIMHSEGGGGPGSRPFVAFLGGEFPPFSTQIKDILG
jgi:hypothetical protein